MAGSGFDVRRFAALDMFGTAGTRRRRRIVRAEFIVGTVGLFALEAVQLADGGWLLGDWLTGAGLNYLPLAVHAVDLWPPGRLEAELAGVDVRAELRRYGWLQLLLLLPLVVAVVGAAQARRRRSKHRHLQPPEHRQAFSRATQTPLAAI